MDFSAAAQLKTLLTGVALPADKATLLEYAVRQHAEPVQIAALRSLPQREYASLDEVTEELLHVQPRHDDPVPRPREESGAPPGGAGYTAGRRSPTASS
jgi:uncharacterized protein DUF2795